MELDIYTGSIAPLFTICSDSLILSGKYHLNRVTILSLASLLVALAIQVAVIPCQRGAYCQTSTGSALTGDITSVINELKGYCA